MVTSEIEIPDHCMPWQVIKPQDDEIDGRHYVPIKPGKKLQ
jgi:hypothetical protein